MRTITDPIPDTVAPRAGDLRSRTAGFAALAFAAIVVLQNAIRGGGAPANGASADEVLTHYSDHRSTTVLLLGTFVLGGTALAVFLGGTLRRLLAGHRPAWAVTGAAGAIGVLALFAVVVGVEQALSVVAAGDQPDLGAVQALWALHNSVFTVLYLFIGLALLGLSRAGIAAGVTPPAFERLAPIGSGLLVIGSVAGPYIAAGEAMVLFGVAGLGFLVWLAFLVATGLRLVRPGRDTVGSPA
jgi:hypothetical protein